MTPKLSQNQKSELKKSCSTTWVDAKTVFEPYPDPKKPKMTPKSSQNQMSELKVTQKMKVVQLHE